MRARRRTLRRESLLHALSNRDDVIRSAKVDAREDVEEPHEDRVLEPTQLDGDLGEDVLTDDHERHAKSFRDEQRNVADHGRVSHREHEVRMRHGEEPPPQSAGDIREVVDRPPVERRTVV